MSVFLRSYPVALNHGPDCSIVEAVHATCASIGLFKPVEIMGPGGTKVPYIDGGMGNNNPTARLLEEAALVFPDQHVTCVVNIGAGRARTISVPASGPFRLMWSSDLSVTLMSMAMDCERMAEDMEMRFRDTPGVYFRFSVDQGLDDIGLADWGKDVVSHAHAYLGMSDNNTKMDRAVQALRENKIKVPTKQLSKYCLS
jgi:predicted acylesterase/phospholipase RssA